MGSPNAWRLGIVSFLVSHNRVFLHWGFVCALLNDLFGIQSRGVVPPSGTACAR
jgi:hypothetical protein